MRKFEPRSDGRCVGRRAADQLGTSPQDVIGIGERIPDPAAGKRSATARADRGGAGLYRPASRRHDRGHACRFRVHRLLRQQPHFGPALAPTSRRAARWPTTSSPGSFPARRRSSRRPKPKGLTRSSRAAGFNWGEPGCSMCGGQGNGFTEILKPRMRAVSTINRNFPNRQGPKSITHLASPAMAAAVAMSADASSTCARSRSRHVAIVRTFSGAAAPLLRDNVDAMTIAPRTPAEKGGATTQGGAETVQPRDLFAHLRFRRGRARKSRFHLATEAEFREAKFLIAGRNFGCGSAREHAVWALGAFGIRCVIAPSFGPLVLRQLLQERSCSGRACGDRGGAARSRMRARRARRC